MLMLSRKQNESIVIGPLPGYLGPVTITVVEIRGDKIRLGIVAPKEVPVHRQEVYDLIHSSLAQPQTIPPRFEQTAVAVRASAEPAPRIPATAEQEPATPTPSPLPTVRPEPAPPKPPARRSAFRAFVHRSLSGISAAGWWFLEWVREASGIVLFNGASLMLTPLVVASWFIVKTRRVPTERQRAMDELREVAPTQSFAFVPLFGVLLLVDRILRTHEARVERVRAKRAARGQAQTAPAPPEPLTAALAEIQNLAGRLRTVLAEVEHTTTALTEAGKLNDRLERSVQALEQFLRTQQPDTVAEAIAAVLRTAREPLASMEITSAVRGILPWANQWSVSRILRRWSQAGILLRSGYAPRYRYERGPRFGTHSGQ